MWLFRLFNEVIVSTLDSQVPFKSVTTSKRSSDPWLVRCRDKKKQARQLERGLRKRELLKTTQLYTISSRTNWNYRTVFSSKRAEIWTNIVNSQKSASRKLWRTIDNTLGRGHVEANEYVSANDFFIEKVVDVRTLTVYLLSGFSIISQAIIFFLPLAHLCLAYKPSRYIYQLSNSFFYRRGRLEVSSSLS